MSVCVFWTSNAECVCVCVSVGHFIWFCCYKIKTFQAWLAAVAVAVAAALPLLPLLLLRCGNNQMATYTCIYCLYTLRFLLPLPLLLILNHSSNSNSSQCKRQQRKKMLFKRSNNNNNKQQQQQQQHGSAAAATKISRATQPNAEIYCVFRRFSEIFWTLKLFIAVISIAVATFVGRAPLGPRVLAYLASTLSLRSSRTSVRCIIYANNTSNTGSSSDNEQLELDSAQCILRCSLFGLIKWFML